MEETLGSCVLYSLQNFLPQNALFLAERLWSEAGQSEDAASVLATTYLHLGKAQKALSVLQGMTSDKNRYLAAVASLKLDKLAQAETLLRGSVPKADDFSQVPNGAAGLFLLAQVFRRQNQRDLCASACKESLKLNPLLWSAFELLVWTGQAAEPEDYFGGDFVAEARSNLPAPEKTEAPAPLVDAPPAKQTRSKARQEPSVPIIAPPKADTTPMAPPVAFKARKVKKTQAKVSTPEVASKIVSRIFPAPTPDGEAHDDVEDPDFGSFSLNINSAFSRRFEGRHQPSPFVGAKTQTRGAAASSAATPKAPLAHHLAGPKKRKAEPRIPQATPSAGASVRKGSLFDTTPGPTPSTVKKEKEPAKAAPAPTRGAPRRGRGGRVGGVAGGRARATSREEERKEEEKEEEREEEEEPVEEADEDRILQGTTQLLTLLRACGEGVRHLGHFHSHEAIEAFKALPEPHRSSAWALVQLAIAHFQLGEYEQAKKSFLKARDLEPWRTEGLEYFSTVLWQLHLDFELSYLAQSLAELDKMAPETWCVTGNCFSLQGDHEAAIKFLRRAIQLDPSYAYAHSLIGHEYIAQEKLDEAEQAFRAALRVDERHYNAWYGLGQIAHRQQRLTHAEQFYRRALQLNSRSAVILCYIGIALQSAKQLDKALDYLNKAIAIDPKNTLAKFKKATVLASKGRYQDALSVLEALREASPREAAVYFLMGKVRRKLRQYDQALTAYESALEYETKNTTPIKTAIQKLRAKQEKAEEK